VLDRQGRAMAQRLVASLSRLMPEFYQDPIHVGSVVDKMALGENFLRALLISVMIRRTLQQSLPYQK
jgi:hypothetical protein